MDCTHKRSYMPLKMFQNAATPRDRERLFALFIFFSNCLFIQDFIRLLL